MNQVISGLICLVIGVVLFFQRQKISEALIASNETFWSKIGILRPGRATGSIAHFMIPAIGVVFSVSGILAILQGLQGLKSLR
jgi:hypothetical protein